MASKLANISEIVCSLSALLTGGIIMHRCCAHTCHSYAIQVTYYTPLMVIVIGWSGLFAAVAVTKAPKTCCLEGKGIQLWHIPVRQSLNSFRVSHICFQFHYNI